jgi:hypothetical protein
MGSRVFGQEGVPNHSRSLTQPLHLHSHFGGPYASAFCSCSADRCVVRLCGHRMRRLERLNAPRSDRQRLAHHLVRHAGTNRNARSTGVVTAISLGTAIITVTSGVKSASDIVYVRHPYGQVGGNYAIAGIVDNGLTVFMGNLVLAQGSSRFDSALTGSVSTFIQGLLVEMNPQTFAQAPTTGPLTAAFIRQDGTVTFESQNATSTWVFEGALPDSMLQGNHAVLSFPSSHLVYDGRWSSRLGGATGNVTR